LSFEQGGSSISQMFGYINNTDNLHIPPDFIHSFITNMWCEYAGNICFNDFVKQIIRKTNSDKTKIEYYKKYLQETPIDLYSDRFKIVISIPEINYEDSFLVTEDEKQIIECIGKVPAEYGQSVYAELGVKFPEIQKKCVAYLTKHVDLIEAALENKKEYTRISINELNEKRYTLQTFRSSDVYSVISIVDYKNKSMTYVDYIDFVGGNFVCTNFTEESRIKIKSSKVCNNVCRILYNVLPGSPLPNPYDPENTKVIPFNEIVTPGCFNFNRVRNDYALTINMEGKEFEVLKIDANEQELLCNIKPVLISPWNEPDGENVEFAEIAKTLFSSFFTVENNETCMDSIIQRENECINDEDETYVKPPKKKKHLDEDEDEDEDEDDEDEEKCRIDTLKATMPTCESFYQFTLKEICSSNNMILDWVCWNSSEDYYLSVSIISTNKKYILASLNTQDVVAGSFVFKAYKENEFDPSKVDRLRFYGKKEVLTTILFLSRIQSNFTCDHTIDNTMLLVCPFNKLRELGVLVPSKVKNGKYSIAVKKDQAIYFLFNITDSQVVFINKLDPRMNEDILHSYLYDEEDCALHICHFIRNVLSPKDVKPEFVEKTFSLSECSSCNLEPIQAFGKKVWGIRLNDGEEKYIVVDINDRIKAMVIQGSTNWLPKLECTKLLYNSYEEAIGAIRMFRIFNK
jgi:hypothetical protein